MNELNDKDLELIVSKEELGVLETNALSIKEKVEAILPNYSSENYNENNIDIAIKDRALLNKSAKALNSKRIELEKKFMEPFENFKSIIKETTDLIQEASSNIDSIVKAVEEKEKEKKRNKIIDIFTTNIGELNGIVPLNKIFNERWLNKTFKLEDVEKELKEKINKIREDLVTIGNLNSKYEVELKNDYLIHFDLGQAINKNADLIKKEELLRGQQEESVVAIEKQKEEEMQEIATTKVEEKVTDEIITYVLKITGKTSQLKALRKFMETNNMIFEKVA